MRDSHYFEIRRCAFMEAWTYMDYKRCQAAESINVADAGSMGRSFFNGEFQAYEEMCRWIMGMMPTEDDIDKLREREEGKNAV